MKKEFKLGRKIPTLNTSGYFALTSLIIAPAIGVLRGCGPTEVAILFVIPLSIFIINLLYDYIRLLIIKRQFSAKLSHPKYSLSGEPLEILFSLSNFNSRSVTKISCSLGLPEGISPNDTILETPLKYLHYTKETNSLSTIFSITPLSAANIYFINSWILFYLKKSLFKWQCLCKFTKPDKCEIVPNSFFQLHYRQISNIPMGEKNNLQIQYGPGNEFKELRNYSQGDDLRSIDWKRSARHTSPVVKIYHPEKHQRTKIFIDIGSKMSGRVKGRKKLDYAIDIASTIGRKAKEYGDKVSFYTFDRKITPIHSITLQQESPVILERTSTGINNLRFQNAESNYEALIPILQNTADTSLLIIITTVSSKQEVDLLKRVISPYIRWHSIQLIVCEDREIHLESLQPATSAKQAYTIASAGQFIDGVTDSLAKLAQTGIDYTYGDVSTIAQRAYTKFDNAKIRGY